MRDRETAADTESACELSRRHDKASSPAIASDGQLALDVDQDGSRYSQIGVDIDEWPEGF